MGIAVSDESFEDWLARRLREELDALTFLVPAARRVPSLIQRYIRTASLAVAVAVAVLLASAELSGSANPVEWIKAAGHSFGLPARDRAPVKSPDSGHAREPADSSGQQSGSGSHESE